MFPPPFHGSSVYMRNIVELLRTDPELEVQQLNISDDRYDVSNIGRLDLLNVSAALKAIMRLTVKLFRTRPEILYVPIAQNMLAYLRDGVFILLGKLFGARVIIHLHGSYFRKFYDRSNWVGKRFIDFTLSRADASLVLGVKLRTIFAGWFSENRIFVLPNFVDPVHPDVTSVKGRYPKMVITYLGNIMESKGVFQFTDALRLLSPHLKSKIEVRIAGRIARDPFTGMSEGDTSTRLTREVSSSEVEMHYLGMISDESIKTTLLQETDIFVFPSWYDFEGQPLVILEAMSNGCPVISTKDVGVIDETVVDGISGILVEKKNVTELAQAIEKLAEDDSMRQQMSANALSEFRTRFTPEHHLQIFRRIIDLTLAT